MTELNDLLNLADTYEWELPPFPIDGIDDSRPINTYIDHTLLKPEATPGMVARLCAEAAEFEFAAAVVNPIFVPQVSKVLADTVVATCAVVGFPLGATFTNMKIDEALRCIDAGATEIDMVIAIGLLKSGEYSAVLDDIRGLVDAVHSRRALVKVIIETSLLTRREKILATLMTRAAGAEFVKTSTGFSTRGATLEDVELMRRVAGPVSTLGVKAAGGVRSLADARAMIRAGANRLGTSSGVKVMQEALMEERQK